MRYRVHYSVSNQRRTAQVEATSPAEAVVKFRHTSPDAEDPRGQASVILSVCPDWAEEEAAW
jgi:hypothetical protein